VWGTARREVKIEWCTYRGELILGKADPSGAAQGKDERPCEERSDDSAAGRAGERAAEVVTRVVLPAAGLGSGRVRSACDLARTGHGRPGAGRKKALQDERTNEHEPNGSSRHRSWTVAAHRSRLAIGSPR